MRMLVAVKLDPVYKKIYSMFSEDYEILPNIAIFKELQETIIGDEINIAIIDKTLHWKDRAEDLLKQVGIPYILFNGNFAELEANIKGRNFSVGSQVVKETQEVEKSAVPEEDVPQKAGLGKKEHEGMPPVKSDEKGGEPKIVYVDRVVPKIIEREVIRTVEVEKRVEIPVEVEKIVERPVEIRVEVPVEVQVEKQVQVPYLKAMPKQLIIIGSLYSGAGSSFVAISLAKVLNSLRVDTCLIEYPVNEPYLYVTLDGAMRLPRDYTFIFPQVVQGQDIKKRTVEWQDEYITWMPADPATGKLSNWTGEHMAKCLYGIKNTVTILDISTAWNDPGLKDIIRQADHVLMVAGPEPARLLSTEARSIKNYVKQELEGKAKIIANHVPEGLGAMTKKWIESLPFQVISRIPAIPSSEMIKAAWEGKTVFDINAELIPKFTDYFFSLVRQIIPREYQIERPPAKGILSWFKKPVGRGMR